MVVVDDGVPPDSSAIGVHALVWLYDCRQQRNQADIVLLCICEDGLQMQARLACIAGLRGVSALLLTGS